ncbi:hypothetical protein Nepgr_030206 [Nepenthes gracilis]|uniref:BHLH domain-containing protein n=1 Tax=Nepenthes gracilis TaxID=150966 RepID=A0AAD3Y3Z3_NEPGR|nr:hypothetical protein Nepgr_030206 [Nepenthes gracilis]
MDWYIDNPFHRRNQSQRSDSGLSRFPSAPSSLLSDFEKDATFCEGYNYNQSPRFGGGGDGDDGSFQNVKLMRIQQNGSQMIAQESRPPQPQYLKKSGLASASGTAEGVSYGIEGGSIGMVQSTKGKAVGGSNLCRQSSSPAGFFANLNSPNGYNTMRAEKSRPITSRPKEQTDFASGLSTSAPFLPQIPEIGEDDARFYSPGLSFTLWNDPERLVETPPRARRDQPNSRVLCSSSDASVAQSCRLGDPHVLSHQFSLPSTSAEIASVEKLLRFQHAVPCKIRAKRGCATHPRSIAERVRRTRISERIKKLQELIPNMEKQMNTTNMLDLAVEYIKDLQEQYKILCDNQARCKCSNGQKSAANQAG